MPDPAVSRIQDWLRAHEQELLDDTVRMLRIPSVKVPGNPDAPYGPPCREALDLALELAESYGFRTVDLDHKIGYAEFGEGPLVVSLGHLDVVPVGDGWKYGPFSATIDGGYLYARGAVDDKGPSMAAFYAARAIKECIPDLGARLRIAFGCDEESGMTCVERYAETEEPPVFGVAPDSDWPLIHGEKGIAGLFLAAPVPEGPFRLVELAGGQRLNIVIDSCRAVVAVDAEARSHVEEKLAGAWDRNVDARWTSPDRLEIAAVGKAAHGSTPWRGDSAAVRIFRLLADLSPLDVQPYYEMLLAFGHPSGVGLGIHGRDEQSQDLTSNLGIVGMAESAVTLAVNIRYPVTWNGEHLRSLAESHFAKMPYPVRITDFQDSPSLYFPLDHPMVKTLVDVYREETGDDKQPGTMGGGTYARKLPNTVSIGTGWKGDGEAHQTDERIKVEHLFRISRIYAHMLYRLAQEAKRTSP